jgi:hypothetical protein
MFPGNMVWESYVLYTSVHFRTPVEINIKLQYNTRIIFAIGDPFLTRNKHECNSQLNHSVEIKE